MRRKTKSSFLKTKKFKSLILFVVLLIGLRIALPFILKYEINVVLKDHITGYTGHIDDLDLSLYRSAYQLEGFELAKVTPHGNDPVIQIKDSDISLLWSALWKKHIVARVYLSEVLLNALKEPPNASKENSNKEEWTDVLKRLVPINIEELHVTKSEVHYRDLYSKPPVNIFIHQINLQATSLNNSENKNQELVSKVVMTAQFKGHGDIKFDAGFNVLRKPQSFDYNFSAKALDLTAFNDFFKAYGGFEVHKGQFDLFSELASSENNLKGYIKPIFTGVEVLDPEKKLASLKKDKHELGATLLTLILNNGRKDQVATKIPLEGTLDKPHVDVWAGIRNALHNAFSEPYERKLDRDINIQTPKGH